MKTTEIIAVRPDKLDEDCVLVTLKHYPRSTDKLRELKPRLVTYKGHNQHWYVLPSYQPTPASITRFLSRIVNGREFRHIQLHLEKLKKIQANARATSQTVTN
ncbi:MAG: hypothetical protein AAGB12_04500 [Pseudomonadota bacterium]